MKVSKEYIVEQIQQQIAEEAEKYLFKHLREDEYTYRDRVSTKVQSIEVSPMDVIIEFKVCLSSTHGEVHENSSINPYEAIKTINVVGSGDR